MKDKVYLFDTTLRDGQQTTGVNFSVSDKMTISKILSELDINIEEIISNNIHIVPVSATPNRVVKDINEWKIIVVFPEHLFPIFTTFNINIIIPISIAYLKVVKPVCLFIAISPVASSIL